MLWLRYNSLTSRVGGRIETEPPTRLASILSCSFDRSGPEPTMSSDHPALVASGNIPHASISMSNPFCAQSLPTARTFRESSFIVSVATNVEGFEMTVIFEYFFPQSAASRLERTTNRSYFLMCRRSFQSRNELINRNKEGVLLLCASR